LRRFRGLFQTENSTRKGDQCHEQTRPIRRSFAEKLSGWLEPPRRIIPGIAREIGVCDGTLRNWVNQAELRSLGIVCGRRRVARLMRAAGLRGCMRGKRRRTTRRDLRAAAPDLLGRVFVAGRPNRVWLADITYVPTREGFLYLAFILDTHSRRIVGWSMDSHMRTELVVDALEMAVWRRKPSAGLVNHSERGAQYTAISFGKRLAEVGIVPSMGRTGSALDRAPWPRVSSPP
jgi:transposase InsO family protein